MTADHTPITELIGAWAVDRPAAAALADIHGTTLGYGELWSRSAAIARHLRSLGLGAEDRVGLLLEQDSELVTAMVGVLRSGAAYVPMNLADPDDRIADVIVDAGVDVVLASAGQAARIGRVATRVLSVADAVAGGGNATEDLPHQHPQALAYVLYTSGSTGKPKGVGVTHANLAAYVDQIRQVLRPHPGEVFSLVQPITFDSCLTVLYPALATGSLLWVVPPERAMDAAWMAAHLRDAAVDYVKITPSHQAALQSAHDPGELMPAKALLLGGEPSQWAWFSELGGARPGCRVINHYGPTETTVGVAALTDPGAVRSPGRNTPLGPAMANAALHVLDDRMRPVAVGEAGELYIGGLTVSRGYLGRPGLTAASFVPDPFGDRPGARLYRTGDRVSARADETFEFLGRADDQVKIRGFRVEPGEATYALAAHPSVADAVVVACADAAGVTRLAGYITGVGGVRIDAEDLRRHAAGLLPPYLVPDVVTQVDAFPLTRNGKLDRAALPVPDFSATVTTVDVAPSTTTEKIIAALFTEVLGVANVGRNDGFFALGGHSLLVAKLISRLRAAFRIEVPIRAVFEAATLAALAERIDGLRGRDREQLPPVPRVPRTTELPASHGQARLWFLNQLDPGSPPYNTNLGVRILGDLDQPALRRCVEAMVERHEVLRTRLVLGTGGLVQLIDPAPVVRFDTVDIADVPEERRDAELAQLIADYTERPFDLTADIPIRSLLVTLAADEHLLLLSMHHVATEGPSMRILYRDLGALYTAVRRGDEPRLEPIAAQYADFAVWQRDLLSSGLWDKQLDFWRHKLAGLPSRVELRTDHPRPAEVSPAGDRVRFEVSGTLTERLRTFAAGENASMFMALLATLLVVLTERTAQQDVAIGIPVAFRPRPELESTVGFFGNTLVLRNDLDRQLSFRELLRQARSTTLEAIVQRDLPFEALVEELKPRRRLGDTPLVNILMVVIEDEQAPVVLDEVTLQAEPIDTWTAKGDMVALFEANGTGLAGEVEFRTDLFTAAGMRPLAARFEQVLHAALDRPDSPIAEYCADVADLPTGPPEAAMAAASDDEYVAPRTDLEREILQRWTDLIGNEDIGVTDNFFHVGGHSLLASRIVGWIRERYGVAVPLRWCFEHPTVAELAMAVLAAQLHALNIDTLTDLEPTAGGQL